LLFNNKLLNSLKKHAKSLILSLKRNLNRPICTVDIFSGEPGESTQLSFTFKNIGRISSGLSVHCSAEEFDDLGMHRKKFARNF
jgi:F0F1-type ATP synthase beta subunit